MNINELKKLVEQKVDEAWFNNLDDFYHDVGKCATIGALGAATLGGCAYVADKGVENNYQYNQQVNQQAADNYKYTEEAYEKWCQDHDLNPDDVYVLDQYNEVIGDNLQEGKIRHMRRRILVENMVRKELKRQLRERERDDEEEEYNPWMNGDASWINGEYDIPYGFHVVIDTRYGTVSIDNTEDEENSYFLQGDEADDLIVDICKYWKKHPNLNTEQAVNDVIRGLFQFIQ